MFNYLLLWALLFHVGWSKPVQQIGDLTPHVYIVTPQAQLQVDSLGHGTPFVHHLTPYTRFVSPHEKTIVYLPAGVGASRSVASIVPKYQYGDIVARSKSSDISARHDATPLIDLCLHSSDINNQIVAKQWKQSPTWTELPNISNLPIISNPPSFPEISNFPNILNYPNPANFPEFSEITNFPNILNYPNLPNIPSIPNIPQNPSVPNNPSTPEISSTSKIANIPEILNEFPQKSNIPGLQGGSQAIAGAQLHKSETPSNKLESLTQKPESSDPRSASANSNQNIPVSSNIKHIEYEIPVTPILVNEPRHQHYAAIIAPSPAHFVDYVQTPVFLSPSIPTIKGRSLAADNETPIIAIPLPEISKPAALPLTEDLKKNELIEQIKKEEIKPLKEKIKEKEGREVESENLKKEEQSSVEQINVLKPEEKLPSSELQPTAATKLDIDSQAKDALT